MYPRMLNVTLLLVALACLLAVPYARAQSTTADRAAASDSVDGSQPITELAGERADSLFQNEYVTVMRVTLEPGEALIPHEGGARTVLSLSDYTIRFLQAAELTEKLCEQGHVHYHEAGVHSVGNVGSTTARFVVFERRDAELPQAQMVSASTDLAEQAPAMQEELLSNETFDVHEVQLEPGQQIPEHTGYARVVYALSDYTVQFTQGGEETRQSFEEGDVHVHEAGAHTVENAGDTPARFLVVELKTD